LVLVGVIYGRVKRYVSHFAIIVAGPASEVLLLTILTFAFGGTAIADMPTELARLRQQVLEEGERRQEESMRMWGEIAEIGRRESQNFVAIQAYINSQRQTRRDGAEHFSGAGTSARPGGASAEQAEGSEEPVRRETTALTHPFSLELRRRMAMEENDLLPDFTPEGDRP